MPSSRALRRSLVEQLEKRRAIRSELVRDAFLAVPRELFVPDHAQADGLAAVYKDDAIVTKKDPRGVPISSSSQPGIMAPMLEMLGLEPGLHVLEVGAGTGYNAALIKTVVGPSGRVTTIDVDPDIARGARAALRRGGYPVRVVRGDGRAGFRQAAPFDRIIVTASARRLERAWHRQLADGGVVVAPLWLHANDSTSQFVLALRKAGPILRATDVVAGGFMTMRGRGQDGISVVQDRVAIAAGGMEGMNGSTFCQCTAPGSVGSPIVVGVPSWRPHSETFPAVAGSRIARRRSASGSS